MQSALTKKYDLRKPMSAKVEAAVQRVLRSGRLYRYDVVANENSEASLLEQDFAKYIGAKYAVALASCTAALNIALYTLGVGKDDIVLIPAFTFIAVPSAIMQTGATARLVEVSENYYLDVNDLRKKISPQTKVLILSHMRGQVGNVDEIIDICRQNNIKIIEDCAHTLGMRWRQQHLGRSGIIACYSMQSYKMLDSGEGGILVTDDAEVCAKAILYSGAYETLWESHIMRPQDFQTFEKKIPCFNARMSNLTAAVIRAQLEDVEKKVAHHNHNYMRLAHLLSQSPHIYVPRRPEQLQIAADSIQFRLIDCTLAEKNDFFDRCKQQIRLQNFDGDNARCFWNWKFLDDVTSCEKTKKLLQFTFDLRLPEALDADDIEMIASIILKELAATKKTVEITDYAESTA
jgi:dTDP-4-amino-4,6-dideoxygalactose transaminase